MKRITTIFMFLMLVCMGAGAKDVTSITDGGYYYIRVGVKEKGQGYVSSSYACSNTAGLFRLNKVTVDDETYYTIYNMSTKKYVNFKDKSNIGDRLEGADAVGDNSYWKITKDEGGNDALWDICPIGSTFCWNYHGGVNNGTKVGLWDYDDDNSKWALQELFSYADSYENITQWYKVRMHSNRTHYMYWNNNEAIAFSDEAGDNNYLWGFVGNPTDGFKIYNYSAGSGKAINNSNPCGLNASGTSVSLKIAAGNAGSNGSAADAFFSVYVEANSYFNYQSGAIKRWSSNDEGSTFMLDEAEPVSPVTGSTNESPIYYAWRSSVGNNPSYVYTVDGVVKDDNNNTALAEANPISDTYAWQFIGNAKDGYLIKNEASNKYLGGRTTNSGTMSMEASTDCRFLPVATWYGSSIGTGWYCKKYNYFIDRSGGKPCAHTSGNKNDYVRLYKVKFELSDDAAGLVVGNQTISDFDTPIFVTTGAELSCENSDYSISAYDGYSTLAEALTNDDDGTIEVTVIEALTISYKLLWQGNELTSATAVKYQKPGESVIAAATVFGAAPAYCTYTDVSTSTIGAETTEVTYTLSWDGPFNFSTDYAHAKWYYLGINRSTADNPEYGVYSASTPYQLVSLEDAQSAGYNGIWAFIGNPYDGLRVVNHGSGEGYYLNMTNTPSMANATYPTYSLLRIKAHTNGAGFTLDNDDYYLGNYNTTETNGGMRTVAAAWAAYHQTCITASAVPYKTLELLDLEAYANSHALGQYFGVDETAYNNTVKSVNAQETVTESDYNTFSSLMSGSMTPRLPESGYYRIKSSGSRGRTSYITYGKLNDTKGFGLVTTANDKNGDYGTVIKLTRVGSGKNYKISVQGLNVQVHSGDNTLFTATESDAPNFAFNHISLSGKCSIYDGSTHGYLHEAGWYDSTTGLNGVVGWTEGDGSNASTWSLEDVSTISVTMNDGGDDHTYATLYLPFGVTIDGESDVDAYIMTIVGEVASGINIGKDIPANTGVILKGTDTSVTLTINDDATATTTDNDLEGTCVVKDAREGAEGVYDLVLGKGTESNTLGFYLAPTGGKLAANKAYLPYTPGAGARVNGFAIKWSDDDVTGIRAINNGKQAQNNGVYYDLSGRRVQNPQHGMYIVNGRVVVIK